MVADIGHFALSLSRARPVRQNVRHCDKTGVGVHCRYPVLSNGAAFCRSVVIFCRSLAHLDPLSHCRYLASFVVLSLSRPFLSHCHTAALLSVLTHCPLVTHYLANDSATKRAIERQMDSAKCPISATKA